MLRDSITAVLVGAHFVLVAAGAARYDVGKIPLAGPALDYYSSMTGAKAGYGFFAPDITGQAGAEFEIIDDAGRSTKVPLDAAPNHEVEVRVADTIEQFANIYMSSAAAADADDQETQHLWHSMAASLCGTVMGQHPEAQDVVFRLQNYTPVSMAEYRSGLRSQWAVLYEARFHRATPPLGGAS